jgi:hypothetical protein
MNSFLINNCYFLICLILYMLDKSILKLQNCQIFFQIFEMSNTVWKDNGNMIALEPNGKWYFDQS